MTASEMKNRLETILSHIEKHDAPDAVAYLENLLLILVEATRNTATDSPQWSMCAKVSSLLNPAVYALRSDPAPEWDFAASNIRSALKEVTKSQTTEG
jgi:hypothetical protein